MVYASVTFEFMPPYLEGPHLYIVVWRPRILSSGWEIKKEDYEDVTDDTLLKLLEEKDIDLIFPSPPEAPQTVQIVPRVLKEVKALG